MLEYKISAIITENEENFKNYPITVETPIKKDL